MSSKTTFKHLTATGELETRTSAREYTHVIVGTFRADTYESRYLRDECGNVVRDEDGSIRYEQVKVADEGDQVVLTWSQSEANAQKGCGDKRRLGIWRMHVEAINGGQR